MSNIDKQALRERYSLQPVPKCHICDAVMTIARASAGAVMYACSGCTYDDNGAHYAPGRSLGDDHYSASRVTIFESGDSDVLTLLDELDAAEKLATQQGNIAVALLDEVTTLRRNADDKASELRAQLIDADNELETLRLRIAELERSETQLIDERDNAESALNDAYKAVMGQAPEWSNWFSFADAIDEIEVACGLWRNQTEDVLQFRARIAELETRTITVKFEPIPMEELGNRRDGKKHPYMFGAGYNSAVVYCESVLHQACAAAGIGVKGE
ncbi:ead/Ea22-like family protein [Citrobacter portucalensis]|uniref:ead/Ea22-like family protein n=1 Tax=Citrobacter portucalensis TaxID=1639133 RepID=UPI0029653B04|nr:ead/Ea22-like family protein [Citrobacter portucalensis]MDW2650277.1 ead/Ea22-like family protein [Citrobacter portucalensis]